MLSWQYKLTFNYDLSMKKPCFVINNKFYDYLIYNTRFHYFLRLLLSIGNCMNSGNATRGCA